MALFGIALADAYFGNTIREYLLFFGILVVAVLVGKIITWITKKVIKAFADKTATKADDIIVDLLEGPVLFTVFVAALYFGGKMLIMSEGFADFYANTVAVFFMINIGWYLIRFINGLMEHYIVPMTEATESDLDDHLVPILRRLVSIVVVIIIVIMALDRFDYNVGSLLAGLGLGGLAFALAAKDLVGNLFGGIAILIDKPFKLGDRIKVNSGEVDGFVREIGLRTTRIETFDTTMIILPNHKVVDSIVENISEENARRIVINLGVEYGTSGAKIEKAKTIIRKNIKSIKGLKPDSDVYFTAFGDFSLNIRVQYWITKEGMKQFWVVQDKLNQAIMKDFAKEKIEFAFPTQTLHLKK